VLTKSSNCTYTVDAVSTVQYSTVQIVHVEPCIEVGLVLHVVQQLMCIVQKNSQVTSEETREQRATWTDTSECTYFKLYFILS